MASSIKIAVVSFDNAKEIFEMVKHAGFLVDDKKPDFVICYGGDGTILFAERAYPQIPKICLRKGERCKTCNHDIDLLPEILKRIKVGEYRIKEEIKLLMRFRNIEKHALNEVQLHNKNPAKAVRFSIIVRDSVNKVLEEIVGDGVVISTPFGSSAYYHSVGGTPFNEGIGIALNNPHNIKVKPFVVKDDVVIRVKVIREDGYIITDNDEEFIEITDGEEFIVRKSDQRARFVVIE